MSLFICIDIGGTAVKYGVADSRGTLLKEGSRPSGITETSVEGLLDTLRSVIRECRGEYPQVKGVAMDTAGIVDPERGVILSEARNFPGYTGTDPVKLVAEECGLPCTVENDVNCAALGEYWLGGGKGASPLVCLTVGTGIGGAILWHGRLLHGATCSAGEVGYMRIPGTGKDWEAAASVTWLCGRVRELNLLPPDEVDGRTILELAESGNREVRGLLELFIRRLALGIVNLCAVLNPETVLLGGGIMTREDYFAPLLRRELEKELPSFLKNTRIAFARLGNKAGMLGALRNFLDRHPELDEGNGRN